MTEFREKYSIDDVGGYITWLTRQKPLGYQWDMVYEQDYNCFSYVDEEKEIKVWQLNDTRKEFPREYDNISDLTRKFLDERLFDRTKHELQKLCGTNSKGQINTSKLYELIRNYGDTPPLTNSHKASIRHVYQHHICDWHADNTRRPNMYPEDF